MRRAAFAAAAIAALVAAGIALADGPPLRCQPGAGACVDQQACATTGCSSFDAGAGGIVIPPGARDEDAELANLLLTGLAVVAALGVATTFVRARAARSDVTEPPGVVSLAKRRRARTPG